MTSVASSLAPTRAVPHARNARDRRDVSASTSAFDAASCALSGGIAACASHSLSVPLDVIKTRLQVEKFEDERVLSVAREISKRDGVMALAAGWEQTFVGYGVQGALKYGGFEALKSAAGEAGTSVGLVTLMACAASAEVVGSAFLTPLEQIRIKTVSDAAYANDGFVEAATRFAAEPGGGAASVLESLPVIYSKMLPYTVVQLVSYDVFTRAFADAGGDIALTRPVSAFAAGVSASLASQPGDTLLSVVNKGTREIEGGNAAVAVKASPLAIAAELGPMGLMTGWRARLAHITSIVFVQLLVYDAVKDLLASS